MDPKNLDPNLKQTYDRVMNTQTNAPQTPAAASSVPNPVTTTVQPAGTSPTADASQASSSTPSYTQDNLNFQAAIQTPVVGAAGGAMQAQAVIAPQHQTSSFLKVLYVIGAIVFFVAYTYLWVKIFNLPVPFLN